MCIHHILCNPTHGNLMGSDPVTVLANCVHRHDQSIDFGIYDSDTVCWKTTLCTSETTTHWALASDRQRTVKSHVHDTCLFACCNMPRLSPTDRQWLIYVGLCFHVVWRKAKAVGDRENLETYSNSVSKNTAEKDFFLMEQNFVDQYYESTHQTET
jgi:hypothetical protein